MSEKNIETVLIDCEKCEARVEATVRGAYERFDSDWMDAPIRFALLECKRCEAPSLITQEQEEYFDEEAGGEPEFMWGVPSRLYPHKARELGEAVPSGIRRIFSEARLCFQARAYTASAVMCRKVLEAICVDLGAAGRGLAGKLKSMKDTQQIDVMLFEWATALRVVGNDAAHDPNISIDSRDAQDTMDFAEAFAEYLYTYKIKFEAFKNRRNGKSKKA